MYCIDASVLTNSFIAEEEFHEHSKRFLAKIKNGNLLVILPEIALPEVASAIARVTENENYALEFVENLQRIPNFLFVPVDRALATLAAELAARHKLRGCDAIYVAVASQFNLKLITLDSKQIERSKSVIAISKPNETA